MGRITSRSCARKDRITLVSDSRDLVFPGAATRRDPTHQIKDPSDQVTEVIMSMYDVVTKIQPISDVKLTSDACWGRVFRICRQS